MYACVCVRDGKALLPFCYLHDLETKKNNLSLFILSSFQKMGTTPFSSGNLPLVTSQRALHTTATGVHLDTVLFLPLNTAGGRI